MRELYKYVPEDIIIVRNGKWSHEIQFYGDLLQVIIIPPSEDTDFTFNILESDGMPSYMRKNIGTLIDTNLQIPIFPGIKTMNITNARYDGIYKVKIIYKA